MKNNSFFKSFSAFLPHLLMTFGLMILTFYCITLVNESMGFLSSYFSQKFEVFYVVIALLTAAASFIKKKAVILAVLQVVCAIAMLIPVCICIAQHRMDLLDERWFQRISLGNAVIAIVFGIVMIILNRKAAYAAWNASKRLSAS